MYVILSILREGEIELLTLATCDKDGKLGKPNIEKWKHYFVEIYNLNMVRHFNLRPQDKTLKTTCLFYSQCMLQHVVRSYL